MPSRRMRLRYSSVISRLPIVFQVDSFQVYYQNSLCIHRLSRTCYIFLPFLPTSYDYPSKAGEEYKSWTSVLQVSQSS